MTENQVWQVAVRTAVGWLASLPVLGIGMGCFWLQRDADGVVGLVLGIGGVAMLVVALLGPGLLGAARSGRRGVASLVTAGGKGLLTTVVVLVLASLLSAVPALRPEEISLFGQDFAMAHAIAVAVPTLFALVLSVLSAWMGGSARRFVWIGGACAAAVAGVALWWWSAGTGYDAIRFTNADEIVLMAQTVTLAALLMASFVSGFLWRTKQTATDRSA